MREPLLLHSGPVSRYAVSGKRPGHAVAGVIDCSVQGDAVFNVGKIVSVQCQFATGAVIGLNIDGIGLRDAICGRSNFPNTVDS